MEQTAQARWRASGCGTHPEEARQGALVGQVAVAGAGRPVRGQSAVRDVVEVDGSEGPNCSTAGTMGGHTVQLAKISIHIHTALWCRRYMVKIGAHPGVCVCV